MERLEQFWFAGNHADIGGGYLENESRLSDIALGWMVAAASDSLAEKGLILDRAVLAMHPAADGIQHDETQSLAFRLAGKSDRDPVPEATLHPTVVERFGLPSVLQYDVMSPYRPEALRGHTNFPGAYDNIPMPRQTCLQLMKASYKAWRRAHRKEHPWRDRCFLFLKGIHMDRVVSCLALLFLVVATGTGFLIFGYQLVEWLLTDIWRPLPVGVVIGGIRQFGSSWLGLQRVYDWILALPLTTEQDPTALDCAACAQSRLQVPQLRTAHRPTEAREPIWTNRTDTPRLKEHDFGTIERRFASLRYPTTPRLRRLATQPRSCRTRHRRK